MKSVVALRSKDIGWIAFFALVLLSWVLMFQMARGDSWICGADEIRLLPFGGFTALWPMWSVMVGAMMLPTLVPVLVAFNGLPAATGRSPVGWWGLVTGYSLVWLAASVGFAGLQVLALRNGWLEQTGIVSSQWSAAALLAVAGFWQFTRGKEACQTGCMLPVHYFLARWRPGFAGGARMGVDFGANCVGCCWAIMALAFVGGMTSLLWMGLATAFMVAEKLPQVGRLLRRPAGGVLLAAAAYVAYQATIN